MFKSSFLPLDGFVSGGGIQLETILVCQVHKRPVWLGRWICNPEVPCSNRPSCHWMDLS